MNYDIYLNAPNPGRMCLVDPTSGRYTVILDGRNSAGTSSSDEAS